MNRDCLNTRFKLEKALRNSGICSSATQISKRSILNELAGGKINGAVTKKQKKPYKRLNHLIKQAAD